MVSYMPAHRPCILYRVTPMLKCHQAYSNKPIGGVNEIDGSDGSKRRRTVTPIFVQSLNDLLPCIRSYMGVPVGNAFEESKSADAYKFLQTPYARDVIGYSNE